MILQSMGFMKIHLKANIGSAMIYYKTKIEEDENE